MQLFLHESHEALQEEGLDLMIVYHLFVCYTLSVVIKEEGSG